MILTMPPQSSFTAGTDQIVGNDADFLSMFKEYNFNTIQIEYQLMPHFIYEPLSGTSPIYVSQSPSTSFLDRADSLGLKVILACSEMYVDRHYIKEYNNNPFFSQYNFFRCSNGLNYYASHPAIIGFDISDEPYRMHLHDVASYCRQIKNYNENLYRVVNVVPSHADLVERGYESQDTNAYLTYINEFVDSIQPNVLPIDIYPIWLNSGNWPRDFFFSLEKNNTKNR